MRCRKRLVFDTLQRSSAVRKGNIFITSSCSAAPPRVLKEEEESVSALSALSAASSASDASATSAASSTSVRADTVPLPVPVGTPPSLTLSVRLSISTPSSAGAGEYILL